MTTARRLMLTLARARGSAERRATQGWGLVLLWLIAVSLGLLALPAAVNFAFDRVPDGTWDATEAGDPHLAGVWSIEAVLLVVAAILAVRALVRARRRIVVEGFANYTKDDKEAGDGLATLLIAELSRLRELYGRVNDELSTPMSFGAQGRGGAGRDTQAGAFLSVTADEVASTLNDAVATEATVSIGWLKIPVGAVLSVVGKLARGPRIVGSLHDTDATGGPRLTAQLVGGRQAYQWQVERERGVEVTDNALLDPMISELAARIFTDLTLRSSVRWRAIRSFTEYLELYWESYRTPRDRGAKLESAEGKLLEAIAEDEGFDLAFYNLGVVYSQLADLEHQAAQRSEYVKPNDRPRAAYEARLDAALAAFNRAVALNRDRAEAIYALAVHEYTRMGNNSDRGELEAIVCRCERVLELDPRHAQAHDLMGIALVGLERFDESEASHRAAVAESWRRLRDVERAERRKPPTTDSLLPDTRSNLAAALRNLADVNHVAAQRGDRPLRRDARVDRLYALACDLASGDTQAATLSAYGQVLECRSNIEFALERYHAALKIDPDNPVYWARLAGAHAASPADEDRARRFALAALGELAPIYRRSLEAHPSHASLALRDGTLCALRRTYERLGDEGAVARIGRLTGLSDELDDATRRQDVGLLLAMKARYGDEQAWEREQVQIALARTLCRQGRWREAAAEYASLIALLERVRRPAGISQHSLHAKHARALRNDGHLQEALGAAAKGLVQDPLSASARREVGKAHFALLQFEEALQAWKQTLWLTPNDPHLHWKVAFCHWSVAQDRRDAAARRTSLLDAVACFESAATLFGVRSVEGWAWSQLWAGRVRLQLEDHDAAIRHLRSAAGCRATDAPGALFLGEALAAVGDYDASRQQLECALACVGSPTGRNVDADWGETLTDHEVRDRAVAGLGTLFAGSNGHNGHHGGRIDRGALIRA